MRIPSGKTDQVIYFVAVDSTDLKTRETGLTSFTVYRSRNGGAATAYTTPTVAELSTANMPGVYALTIDEDTTIASGSDSEEYCVHITQASMAPVTRTIELYRRDTTSGQTITVANGAADADLERIQGTVVSTPATAGILDVNVKNIDNDAASASGTVTFPNATLASTTNITAGTITTATNVTTVNGLAANVITAAAIATGAIDADALAADAVAEIANGVWDEDATGHQTAGTFGQTIGDSLGDDSLYGLVGTIQGSMATPGDIPTAAENATAVWDMDATLHQTQGTFGQAIGDPGADTDTIWSLANTNLDAAVSSRLASASYTAPLDAAGTRTAVGLAAANLDTQLTAIDDFLDTEVAAIKAKTDNLPADPADASDIAALIDALPTAAENAVAVWDEQVDGTVTARQSIRLANSANGAKLSGAATTSIAIRDLADTKNRVAATVDNDGNRTAITLDLT